MLRWGMVCLLVVFSSSCGPKSSDLATGVRPEQFDRIEGQKEEVRQRARAAAKGAYLKCTLEGECDPAVALIAVATDEGLERCSGVLIARDRVLTNDHCVNKSLSLIGWGTRNRGLPCKGSVFVHFAGDDEREPQHVGCAEIEFRSGESGINSQDYSVIRLDRAIEDRKPLAVSKRGFRNGERSRILRVQMNQGGDSGYGGTQSFLECQASLATYLYPLMNSSDSPVMTFGDCNIQPGNSGAPILNSDGEISGIVQGYLTLKSDAEVEQELREHLLDDSYGWVGIGSQTRCMGHLNPSMASSCTSIPPFSHFYPKVYLDLAPPFEEELLPKFETGEKWVPIPTYSPNIKRFISIPACVKGAEFDSHDLRYRKGINHRMQSEWRVQSALGETQLRFTRKETSQKPENVVCEAIDGTRVEIPACH